jgi:Protein of unknown function (DUF2690)
VRRTWRVVAVAVAVGILSGFVTPAAPARAAIGCVDSQCNGLSAADMGCNDDKIQMGGASPISEAGTRRDVILWYSNACRALWAYYFSTSTNNAGSFAIYSQAVYGGKEIAVTINTLYANNETYTTMVPWSSQSTKACYQPVPGVDPEPMAQYDNGTPDYCTKWY